MINFANKKLLVIAPHPDDEVIGCGGLISHVKAAKGEVYVLFLTVGSTPNFSRFGRSTEQERMKEIERVAKFMGYDGWRVAFPGDAYHLKLDVLPQRELVREIEVGAGISLEAIRPDIIVFPLVNDYNQDHRAAAAACFSACRPAPRKEKYIPDLVMSYETPMDWWSHPTGGPNPNLFVTLTTQQVKKKTKAMSLYKSQVREKGHPRNGKSLQVLTELRGACVGASAAEGFYCHKLCRGA